MEKKVDKTKGNSKLKNIKPKDMEQALRDYELGISERKEVLFMDLLILIS